MTVEPRAQQLQCRYVQGENAWGQAPATMISTCFIFLVSHSLCDSPVDIFYRSTYQH